MIYLNLKGFTSIYIDFSQFTPIYLYMPQFTLICLILPWFTQFTSIYLDLPQFTSIYLDLPQFTLIYPNIPQFTMNMAETNIKEQREHHQLYPMWFCKRRLPISLYNQAKWEQILSAQSYQTCRFSSTKPRWKLPMH